MSEKIIFTIDARENMFLEVVKEYFSLSDNFMYKEIKNLHEKLEFILEEKGIYYKDLKNCLIPKPDRNEIGLVFDISKIKNNFYGYTIFKKIIPFFNKLSSHSILCGDYIGENELQKEIFINFYKEINLLKEINYLHSTQFFIVYINNLSDKMFNDYILKLNDFEPFIGYFELTNQSFIKSYLSTILVNSFIKHKDFIIMGHEDDRDNSEDINLTGFPFKENNYKVKSLQDIFFGIFLSYKIERAIFKGFEPDLEFSLNSISPIISIIEEIEISKDKLEYLKNYKTGKLKKANLINTSKDDLVNLIKNKIKSNYIYNMTELKTHNVMKFDIVIEIENLFKEIVKITIGFEYIPQNHKLRLITLY